jgi:hypothetical protein
VCLLAGRLRKKAKSLGRKSFDGNTDSMEFLIGPLDTLPRSRQCQQETNPVHSGKQQTNRKQVCVHCEEVICRTLINSVLKMS